MKRSPTTLLAVLISVAIHSSLLFLVPSNPFQSVEFGIQEGTGPTHIDLVASASEEEPLHRQPQATRKTQPTPTPKDEDVTQPETKKTRALSPIPSSTDKIKNNLSTTEGKSTEGTGSPQVGTPGGSTSAKPDYLRNPPPEYPEEAKDAHQEGIALLLVEVSETGAVVSVLLQKSSGFRKLDDSAIKAVKGWKFKPATKDGAPIQSKVEVPVRFRLN